MNKYRSLVALSHTWCREFISILFDFSFRSTITTKMLPLLYGIGIFCLITSCGYFALLAFMEHWIKGVLFVSVLAPVGILFGIALIRIGLEFFAAVFTMLSALRNTLASISRLENTFLSVEEDIGVIRRRFSEMTLTLESMESRLARMESVLIEIDEIATRIPFLKTRKSNKKDANIIEASLRELPEVELPEVDPKGPSKKEPSPSQQFQH